MTPRLSRIFKQAFLELRPQAPLPEFEVRFFAFANLNNTIRLRRGRLLLRLSDLLDDAPDAVLHAITHILLAKLYRDPIDATLLAGYRKFAGSQPMLARTHQIRRLRGRKHGAGAEGEQYHLEEIFDDLNHRFFQGLIARPKMSWSKVRSRQRLGHYDPAHNTIVVSRIFDRPGVPRYAIEYLVFHELLHLRHPVGLSGSRRCVHSRAFREEEKLFPHLAEARRYVKQL
ncbi:MAG TPA: M48 family peptidase [Terriglobales bacterium]